VPAALRLRLMFMMFLQYALPGAILPVFSYYLMSRLHFSSSQASLIMSMAPLSAFVALPVAAYIGDRYLSAERLLALCHLVGGLFMGALVVTKSFWPFLLLYLCYGMAFMPTFALTNTIAFHHARQPRRDFGGIRMWGTIGWVAIAWGFGFLWLGTGDGRSERLHHALILSAAGSLLFAAYALTLPRSSVDPDKQATFIPKRAIRLFLRPSLFLLGLFTILTTLTHQFYYFGMSPFLSGLGFKDAYLMPSMSLGQMTEILFMGLVGPMLARFGYKPMLILSVLANIFRFVVFALGGPAPLILLGLSMHGICYAFFFTTAFIYVNDHADPRTRAGAQQLFSLLVAGLGTLTGFLAAGITGQMLTDPATGHIAYRGFWAVPVVISILVLAGIAWGWKEEKVGETCVE
jgi:nucleoside transporter